MRAEILAHWWAALLLAALLTTGCASLAPGPGVARASTDEAAPRALFCGETAPLGPPSCGGQNVPPGWPNFSFDDGETLLAPFLTCASPAEFLALQDRVDMPRLVERLDDWGAVRLGSLGTPRVEVSFQ